MDDYDENFMMPVSVRRNPAADVRTSGFLPEWGPHQEELTGLLEEYKSTLGIGREQFNADLAARGIYRAGEAPKAMYRDVVAPVYRAGAQATRQAYTDYLKMYQQGRFAEENLLQQERESRIRVWMFQEQMKQRERESRSSFWSNFLGGLFQAGGYAAGAALGGPAGGAAGAAAGKKIGGG